MVDDVNLTFINNREDLNFFNGYNRIYRDAELNDDPYFGLNFSCNYHDLESLSSVVKEPIYLSINIQSLYSKHDKLLQLLLDLNALNIVVDAVAIQEIWDIQYVILIL